MKNDGPKLEVDLSQRAEVSAKPPPPDRGVVPRRPISKDLDIDSTEDLNLTALAGRMVRLIAGVLACCLSMGCDTLDVKCRIGLCDAMELIEDAISSLETESSAWRDHLNTLQRRLTSDAQATLANEVSNLFLRTVATTSASARCDFDFAGNRVKQQLRVMLAKLRGEPIAPLKPTICDVVPPQVDVAKNHETIHYYGYDFDIQDEPDAYLLSSDGPELALGDGVVDVPHHYLATVNVLAPGFPFRSSTNSLELRWKGGVVSKLAVIPEVCGAGGQSCCTTRNACDVGSCIAGICSSFGGTYGSGICGFESPNGFTQRFQCPSGFGIGPALDTVIDCRVGTERRTASSRLSFCTTSVGDGAWGGAYQEARESACGNGQARCLHRNPYTQACGCPAGTTPVELPAHDRCQVAGGIGWAKRQAPIFLCVGGGAPTAFGGAYLTRAGECRKRNPALGSCGCPSGTEPAGVPINTSGDQLHICTRSVTAAGD